MILNLHDVWDTQNSTPFASITCLIMNEINQKLSVLIRSEIISHSPKTTCSDADTKSIKSSSRVEKLRVLHFPSSVTFDSMQYEEHQNQL